MATEFTYRYRWQGGRMIVKEYFNGRYQHEYYGYITDNGYSADIYPIKGRRSFGDIPYTGKRISCYMMERDDTQLSLPEPEAEPYDETAWHYKHQSQSEGEQVSLL